MEGFLRYEFGGLIHGGAYFRNFTASPSKRAFEKYKPQGLFSNFYGSLLEEADVVCHKSNVKQLYFSKQ